MPETPPADGAPALPVTAIAGWLQSGWAGYRATLGPSTLFATLLALIGAAGMALFVGLGLAPMVYPWAGAFMLAGPALLCGYFELASRRRRDGRAGLGSLWAGFRGSPPALWLIGLVTAALLMIWMTDAAIVYALYFGHAPVHLDWALLDDPARRDALWSFFVFCTLLGSVLALLVYAVTAFGVPMIYFDRLPLTRAVGRSVRLVAANPATMFAWGVLLTVAVIGSILLFLPAFVVLFPVLAHASEAAYRQACPSTPDAGTGPGAAG